MRQVVVILGVSIDPEDARWLEFGLNRPRRSLGKRRVLASQTADLSPIAPIALPQEMAPEAGEAVAA